jgi:hypothetical protein
MVGTDIHSKTKQKLCMDLGHKLLLKGRDDALSESFGKVTVPDERGVPGAASRRSRQEESSRERSASIFVFGIDVLRSDES